MRFTFRSGWLRAGGSPLFAELLQLAASLSTLRPHSLHLLRLLLHTPARSRAHTHTHTHTHTEAALQIQKRLTWVWIFLQVSQQEQNKFFSSCSPLLCPLLRDPRPFRRRRLFPPRGGGPSASAGREGCGGRAGELSQGSGGHLRAAPS